MTAYRVTTSRRNLSEQMDADYRVFLWHLWKDRRLDENMPLGELEFDVAAYAQHGPAKRIILAFRFFGKTHIVTVSYALWRFRRDPETKIPLVSKSLGHSKDALGLARRWIDEVPFLQHLHPENGEDKKDTTEYFDVGPCRESAFHSLHAFGIGGQLTGRRGHVLIFDDIETSRNTLTHTARQQLHVDTHEFHHVAKFGAAEVIGVGTFHHEDTVYTKMQQEGYDVRSWPKVFPASKDRVLNLSPILQDKLDSGDAAPGDITAPYRVTPEHIADDRKLGVTAFGMQCALVCNVGEGNKYPLRLSDIVVYDNPVPHDGSPEGAKVPISIIYGKMADGGKSTALEHADLPSAGFGGDVLHRPAYVDTLRDHYAATKAAVDPAGKGADRIGFAIGSSLHANVFLHDVQGLDGGARLENFDHIALTCRTYGVREIVLETNIDVMGTFAQMLEAAIRRHMLRPGDKDHLGTVYLNGWSASIAPLHSHGQKELRICTTLEPILGSHQLIVHPRVLELNEDRDIDNWQYQLTRMRRVPNCLGEDGKIDATQMLIQAFRHTLHADPAQRAKRTRDQRVKEELAKLKGRGEDQRNTARYFEHR